jgi:anti-sigma regulatory factor (Ser/Thr protein kinase)
MVAEIIATDGSAGSTRPKTGVSHRYGRIDVKPEQPNGGRSAHPVHIYEADGDVGERAVTSREFRAEDTAPGAARRFIEQSLRRWGHDGSVIDDARLLVSELVTNAVNHTRSPFSVSVAARSPKVRVAVHDRSSTIPVKSRPSSGAPSGGRGLQIVADLADDWGVVRTPLGKTVWAELSARPA